MTQILQNIQNPGPAGKVVVVTPSDTIDLVYTARAIRANTAGTIQITCPDGTQCVCNFLAGETRKIMASRIWATSTTATGIEAMF